MSQAGRMQAFRCRACNFILSAPTHLRLSLCGLTRGRIPGFNRLLLLHFDSVRERLAEP